MRELSLFSGAGGGLLATKHLLGWKTVGYVEIEPYCQEVLKARIADGYLDPAPVFSDIRKFISDGYAEAYQGMVDVITGGFPCQDISCAGKGAGIGGERSGLWREFASVIRLVRPRYALIENSPVLTSRGLDRILSDLAEMGFDAEWGVIGAGQLGAPHVRERMWIVSHSSSNGLQERKHVFWVGTEKSGSEQSGSEADRVASQIYPDAKCGERPLGRKYKPISRNGDWPITTEPVLDRGVDGMACRLDRLRAIGNGQVPIVAATAWKILSGQ